MKNTQVRNSNLSPQILTSQGASGRQACCLDVRCGQIALSLSRAVVEQNLTSSEVREASTVLVDDPVRAIQTLPGMSAAGNKMGSRCPHLSLRERWGTRPRREPYKWKYGQGFEYMSEPDRQDGHRRQRLELSSGIVKMQRSRSRQNRVSPPDVVVVGRRYYQHRVPERDCHIIGI
jgi:hypothetical protein